MQKLWQKHQKFMKGNAGFSLVELIIVIAIMAALVAILAPQYMKYVEKSRVAADETTLDEVLSAVQVALADPENTITNGETITISTAGKIESDITNSTILADVVASIGGSDTLSLKSTTYKGVAQTIEITSTADSLVIHYGTATTFAWAKAA